MNRVITQANSQVRPHSRANVSLLKVIEARLQVLGFRLGAVARAHARRRAFEAVQGDTMHDIGIPPDTATGLPGWEPDLPFFMQSGFHRR